MVAQEDAPLAAVGDRRGLLASTWFGSSCLPSRPGRPVTQAEWDNRANVPLPCALQSRRPIAGFGSISAVLPEGFSTYNALQAKLEKRFAGSGLYFLNSFTWSKAIDNGSQVLEEPNGNTGTPQNVNEYKNDEGAGRNLPISHSTTRRVLFGKCRSAVTDGSAVIGIRWSMHSSVDGRSTASTRWPADLHQLQVLARRNAGDHEQPAIVPRRYRPASQRHMQ